MMRTTFLAAFSILFGCAPEDPFAGPMDDASFVCEGVCPGEAPLAGEQEGVCAGLRQVCLAAQCRWVDPRPAALEIVGYEAEEARCDGLDNDCDGEVDEAGCVRNECRHPSCEPYLRGGDAVLFEGGEIIRGRDGCGHAAERGWHSGVPINEVDLSWTHASDCALPRPGDERTYAGRMAVWYFPLEQGGVWRLEARVPAPAYVCSEHGVPSGDRYARGLVYRLSGADGRVVDSTPLDPVAHAGGWMPAIPSVELAEGDYVLTLFDRGERGLPCAESAGASVTDPAASDWLFVDTIRMTREGP